MDNKAKPLAVALREMCSLPQYQARFNEVLGKRAPQFISSMAAVARSLPPDTDPQSIMLSSIVAATLDLPIQKDLGFAWIVPYGRKAQFQMGYKGYTQLALRTGSYKTINTCIVYEGELVSHDKLSGEIVIDQEKRKSDKIIGYAAYFSLVNGFEKMEYWTREAVEAHAARFSQAYKSKKKDSPWFSDFDKMAQKTVLKSLLSHYGILSVEMRTALRTDQAVIKSVDGEDIETEYVDTESQIVESEIVKNGAEKEKAEVAPTGDEGRADDPLEV